MSPLQHYFYLSSASRLMSREDLSDILETSRRNNGAVGISGMLLYRDGAFAQYIEGPSEPLEAAVQRIRIDPRHKGLIRLTEGPAAERLFGDWSMGFRQADEIGAAGFHLDLENLEGRVPEGFPAHVRTIMRTVYENAND